MDDKKYIVNKNELLKHQFQQLYNNYQLKDVQDFINKVIAWYTVKFEDRYLKEIMDDKIEEDTSILKIMNFDSLLKNYSVFERDLFERKNKNRAVINFQKEIVIAIGWGLIYHQHSSPEYGYYRATQMIKDFNRQYDLGVTLSIYKPTITRKYTLNDEKIRQELEKKELEKKKEEKQSIHPMLNRVRSLFKR